MRIQLHSFEAILGVLARGILEDPEFDVDNDPRTGAGDAQANNLNSKHGAARLH